ncbi:hypothetical protein ACFLZO_00465, partial [Patescibacteria group bacterium]
PTAGYGIYSAGTTMGGRFYDSDSTGWLYAGYGGYGAYGAGSTSGAYFYDTDGDYARVGYGSYSIYGNGRIRGATDQGYSVYIGGDGSGNDVELGVGSGFSDKTKVAGSQASFGIWHGDLGKAEDIIAKYGLHICRIHTHIGSGTDPLIWQEVAGRGLVQLQRFREADCLNIGGGFMVARAEGERDTDIVEVGNKVGNAVEEFFRKTGRRIRLEIEPGAFLVAKAGILLATVQDIKTTDSLRFLVLDTGMTEIIRPTLYGSRHQITVVPSDGHPRGFDEYVVTGHCCETGDMLTVGTGDGEFIKPLRLKKAEVGDVVLIGGAGAYCASMSAKNYNSFPEAPEVMVMESGDFEPIRSRQTLSQMIENEL